MWTHRRFTVRITLIVVFLLLLGNIEAPAQSLPRVRPADQALANLIQRGRSESPTFRRLMDTLEAAEWLIFIQLGRCPDRVMVGCLVHTVGTFEERLYLRLLVSPEARHPDVVVSTLAHEPQDAHEVVSRGLVPGPAYLVV